MNIGITFGGYCPLHQGHLDLIMQCKKENDLSYVFVAGYDDDRGGKLLTLPKRYRLIKNFLECDVLKVKYIDDGKLGLDESMSESNWRIWLRELFDQIENDFPKDDGYIISVAPKYCFYVGEQSYKDVIEKICKEWGYNVTVILVDRGIHVISGTECRANPLKHWYEIAQPFRPYFSHNILVAGTASEGKTTLVQDIGKYFGLPYSYEKGRDNCALKTDPEFNFKDFMYNLYEQHKLNETLIASPQNPGVFISDTDNLVTLMYAYFYAQREGFGINMDEYKVLESVAKEYAKTTKWDRIFLLAPHKRGIVDDGERYMPDSDYDIRYDFFNFLVSMYDDLGYDYEILTGDFYENYLAVKNYIEGLYV